MDYDISNNATAFKDMQINFDYNYYNTSNRAPLGYYFHTSAFLDGNGVPMPSAITFYQNFFRWVVTNHTNVLFATEDRVINWMKNSTSTTTFAQQKVCQCFNVLTLTTPN